MTSFVLVEDFWKQMYFPMARAIIKQKEFNAWLTWPARCTLALWSRSPYIFAALDSLPCISQIPPCLLTLVQREVFSKD